MFKNIKKHENNDLPLENIKSKYILANTVKTNKLSSKLLKSINNVTIDKSFIGYNENDYENVEQMCNLDNVNLFVKNKSHFASDIICNNSVNIKSQVSVGYTENELENLNNDTFLHVKGDSEINGNLFVYQNINCDKNITVQQCMNIGFEKDVPDNTSKLNVNGNSEFVGDNIVYGSEYIKNNLIVNDKSTFYNDIFLNNSMSLKKETIDNIIIDNNFISSENYKTLLNNILSSIQNYSQNDSSALKFYSKKNSNIYSGLLSASKKFILSKKKIIAFILVFCIYSKSKILCVKPVLDTFVLIDSKENIIKISNINSQQHELLQTNDTIQLTKKNKTNIINNDVVINTNNNTQNENSIINSTIDLIKNNSVTNLFKNSSDYSDSSNNSESSFISNTSKTSKTSKTFNVKNNFNNVDNDKLADFVIQNNHDTNNNLLKYNEFNNKDIMDNNINYINILKNDNINDFLDNDINKSKDDKNKSKDDNINDFIDDDINKSKDDNINDFMNDDINKSKDDNINDFMNDDIKDANIDIFEITQDIKEYNQKQIEKYKKKKDNEIDIDSDIDLAVFEIIK